MTLGYLISSKHQEIAKQYLESSTFLVELNSQWSCIFKQNDKKRMGINLKCFSESLIEMSMFCPVMYFFARPDTTFCYAICSNKKIISHFKLCNTSMFRGGWVTYDFPQTQEGDARAEEMLEILAEAGVGPNSKNFKSNAKEIFEDLNLNAFNLLDCTDTQVTALGEILTYEYCDRYTNNICYKFMEILDFGKLLSLHWDYLNEFDLAKISPESKLISRG